MFDLAINNAHILYKHNCVRVGVKPISLFRLELACALLCVSQQNVGCSSRIGASVGTSQLLSSAVTCVNVDKVGLKRGRCHICAKEKLPSNEQKHTHQACPT